MILFSGLLVYTLNNGVLSTLDILGHLLVTLLVCLIPYLVGFRLFHTYSGIIRYSSFVDLQKVGFAVLFGLICVVVFQALTDFSPYLVYIRKRDLILSALLAMSLMWMMRVFVKFFYVSTFRVAKAERAFIYGVKQGGESHERDGLLETYLRDLRAELGQGNQGWEGEWSYAIHDDSFRECAGIERFRDPVVQGTDQAGRPGYGDAQGYHSFLHADTGGL